MARSDLANNAFRNAQRLLDRTMDSTFEPVTTITRQDAEKLARDMKLDPTVTNLDGSPWNTNMNQEYEAEPSPVNLTPPVIQEEDLLPKTNWNYFDMLEKAEKVKANKMFPLGQGVENDIPGFDFVTNWGKYYQTDDSLIKNTQARYRLALDYTVPKEAEASIDIAADIFDTDKGYSAEDITGFLTKIGQIESQYKTKVQKNNGPAKSYWQVEPKTAMSLVKNSSAYFGEKFEEQFNNSSWNTKGSALSSLRGLNKSQMTKLLLEDSDLAAVFAAGKLLVNLPAK